VKPVAFLLKIVLKPLLSAIASFSEEEIKHPQHPSLDSCIIAYNPASAVASLMRNSQPVISVNIISLTKLYAH